MTENECINKIQWRIDIASAISGDGKDGKAFEDLEMAIQALEEIQQYRAIGTVEELQSKLEAYRELGTMEELKALKEKSEPKKAILSRKHHEAYCPNCHFVISDGEFYLLDEYVHYCEDCGQAVKGTDWQ